MKNAILAAAPWRRRPSARFRSINSGTSRSTDSYDFSDCAFTGRLKIRGIIRAYLFCIPSDLARRHCSMSSCEGKGQTASCLMNELIARRSRAAILYVLRSQRTSPGRHFRFRQQGFEDHLSALINDMGDHRLRDSAEPPMADCLLLGRQRCDEARLLKTSRQAQSLCPAVESDIQVCLPRPGSIVLMALPPLWKPCVETRALIVELLNLHEIAARIAFSLQIDSVAFEEGHSE